MKLFSKLLVMVALYSFGSAAWACSNSCAPREANPEPKAVEVIEFQL